MKRRIAILVILALAWVQGANSQEDLADTITIIPDSIFTPVIGGIADSILMIAEEYIGTPYSYGSISGTTFDCSGFVSHCFGRYGFELPHGSGALASIGEEIKLDEIRKGDLLFFNGRKAGGKNIGHVAMVLSVEGEKIRMIHATRRGVIIDDYPEMDYYRKRFVKACRIIPAE